MLCWRSEKLFGQRVDGAERSWERSIFLYYILVTWYIFHLWFTVQYRFILYLMQKVVHLCTTLMSQEFIMWWTGIIAQMKMQGKQTLQTDIIQNLNNFQKVITVRILSHISYCQHKLWKGTHNQPDSSFLFYSLKVYGFNIKYLQVQAELRHFES